MSFTPPSATSASLLDAIAEMAAPATRPTTRHGRRDARGAGTFAAGVFAPLNRIGDTIGARWDNGVVTMPDGFQPAYAAFVEGGWMSLAAPEAHGGQGLPLALAAAVMEDLNAANIGFSLCPMLTLGAIEALETTARTN